MKSKHCPARHNCRDRSSCETCAHGQQYIRMANKIRKLQRENSRLKNLRDLPKDLLDPSEVVS